MSIVIISCGSHSNNDKDSESIADNTPALEDDNTTQPATITKEGIDSIKVGMKVAEIPQQINGLYDQFTQATDIGDIEALQYDFLFDGKVRFSALDFGEGNIDVIFIAAEDINAEGSNGDKLILGDDFRKVTSLPGVKTEWIPYDTIGMWAWNWNGLWFLPTVDGVSHQLAQKLYESNAAPKTSDFDSSVKIDFIGTGLPF